MNRRDWNRFQRIMSHADSDPNLNQNINIFMDETRDLFTPAELREVEELTAEDLTRSPEDLSDLISLKESDDALDALAVADGHEIPQLEVLPDDNEVPPQIPTEPDEEEYIPEDVEVLELQALEEYPVPQPSPSLWDTFTQQQVQVPEDNLEPVGTSNWMALVHSLNDEFCKMHSFPPSKFPFGESVSFQNGDVFAIQVPSTGVKTINGQNSQRVKDIKVQFVVEAGKHYLVVIKDYHQVTFSCRPSVNKNARPAIVRIFVIDNNQNSFPKYPLRENQSFALIGLANFEFQFQMYPSQIPAEMFESITEEYTVPLMIFTHSEQLENVRINASELFQIKFYATNHEPDEYRITNITTRPVVFADPIAFPEIKQDIEPWKHEVHRMNQDLRVVTSLKAAEFLVKVEGETQVELETKTIYAVQMKPNSTLKFRASGTTGGRSSVNVQIMAGLNYFIVRRVDEIWTITCADHPQRNTHAVIRIISIYGKDTFSIPLRSNVPYILLARADVTYRLRMFPPDFQRSLIPRLDPNFPPVKLKQPLDQMFLRLEMITCYEVSFEMPQHEQATSKLRKFRGVMKVVTDMEGSTDSFIRTAVRAASFKVPKDSSKELEAAKIEHGF